MAANLEISTPKSNQPLVDHNLVDVPMDEGVLFEKRPARTLAGEEIDGLYNAWITLNNPAQYKRLHH